MITNSEASFGRRRGDDGDGGARTFGHFDTLDRLVIHGASTLFDELVALDAKIEDARALYDQLDEPFHRDVDDISRSLPSSIITHGEPNNETMMRKRGKHSMGIRTLYLVISASAVERGFSEAAGAGTVFSESDMI